jgi:hypothetical protein
MAALLGELVAIPTENPPGNHYWACTDLLVQRIQLLGLDRNRIAPDTDATSPSAGNPYSRGWLLRNFPEYLVFHKQGRTILRSAVPHPPDDGESCEV